MRELLKIRLLKLAGPGGVFIAAACAPFILRMSRPGALRTMQLIALPPISILLLQVSLAWTPQKSPRRALCSVESGRGIGVLTGLSLALALSAYILLDPLIVATMPRYFPESLGILFLSLPWIGLFQPLFLVAGVYAFTFRLSRRRSWAVAGVILAHQGILLLQLGGAALEIFPTLIFVAGLYGLILGWTYQSYGLCGPAMIAIVSQLRHVGRLL